MTGLKISSENKAKFSQGKLIILFKRKIFFMWKFAQKPFERAISSSNSSKQEKRISLLQVDK